MLFDNIIQNKLAQKYKIIKEVLAFVPTVLIMSFKCLNLNETTIVTPFVIVYQNSANKLLISFQWRTLTIGVTKVVTFSEHVLDLLAILPALVSFEILLPFTDRSK
ncbi:hypothetical protein BpHYR1_011181 [Brachionus plicatilis]|uniref:Uncharacterized protein n=1 Tax=Brachionus plicatilis TaxID=10195 RepID=A0A3M7PM76_BRAPC|nr:hypothetical protein BpHYR1_011181 [Brachionus plicatilis]